VEEEDDEEVASPSSLLLFDDDDDDDDDDEKTNPLPLLFCLFFVFAFLFAKKRLICFKLDEEEEKEVLVLAREREGARVVGDAKQTLPDISIISIYYLWRNFRILEEKKRTTTHERAEFLQHVLSLSLVVVVFFIVPDLHVQRPGAVLREIRVVFMDET
jgi:hypothetical protein